MALSEVGEVGLEVVFITGGTRGGRQIALIFAKAGYQLAFKLSP